METLKLIAFLVGVLVLIVVANELVRPYALRAQWRASRWYIKRCEASAEHERELAARAAGPLEREVCEQSARRWLELAAAERAKLPPER